MSDPPDQPIAVFITAPHQGDASRLADMLVERRFAACVQILPAVESVYRWQGRLERQAEVLLIAKTLTSKFAELEREVCALHSYETPEIVAVTLTAVSEPYRQWLNASVTTE
jgi:periplasmic divalent cation tolerance protein